MIEHFLRDGSFHVGGLPLDDLLQGQATPVYVYSADRIRENFARAATRLPGFDLFYSLKANPSLAICRTLLQAGANAEVSSVAELETALTVGFQPEQIIMVGPAKTEAEIQAAVTKRIYAVVAESALELQMIEAAAQRAGHPIRVLLRINTSEHPQATETMVGGPSKFGFDEEEIVAQVRSVELKAARLAGIHVYAASQVLDASWIAGHIVLVAALARRLSSELGFCLECVDFGGGFGVPYTPSERELDLTPVSRAAERARRELSSPGDPVRLLIELGRYLVADAGIYMTRVLGVKRSRGTVFVVVDGGMQSFTRPVLLRTEHPLRILNKIAEPAAGVFQVCGRSCTPLDVIGDQVELPYPAPGDILGVFNAGAYGLTMSIVGFMGFGSPAELMVEDGRVREVRRAWGPQDLLSGQTP